MSCATTPAAGREMPQVRPSSIAWARAFSAPRAAASSRRPRAPAVPRRQPTRRRRSGVTARALPRRPVRPSRRRRWPPPRAPAPHPPSAGSSRTARCCGSRSRSPPLWRRARRSRRAAPRPRARVRARIGKSRLIHGFLNRASSLRVRPWAPGIALRIERCVGQRRLPLRGLGRGPASARAISGPDPPISTPYVMPWLVR
jgi:hypothetical protein